MQPREVRRLKSRVQDRKTSEQIEKKHQSHPLTYLFSVVVLVIVVVTFIALPMRGAGNIRGSLVFGVYNGESIQYVGNPPNYFARQQQLLAERMESQDPNANREIMSYQVWQDAFEQTVVRTAILQDAARSGLIVTNHKIDDALAKYGPYVQNGRFSTEAYDHTSPTNRAANRRLYAGDLTQTQYYADVLQGQKVSARALSFIEGMASPERKFKYVVFSFSQYPADLVVKFGEAHSSLFRTINLSRITIKSSEADADAIYKKLQQTPNLFEEIAKNDSKDAYADKGGSMGWVDYNTLKPDFQDIADLNKLFTMKSGEISPVFRTSFGWVIYRIDQPARQPDFTDPKTVTTVRTYMEQYERGTIQDYLSSLANSFRDVAARSGFDAAAVGHKLAVHQTNYFPINFGGASFLPQMKALDNNGALANGAYDQSFFHDLFSLKVDELSKPILLDTNVVVVEPLDQRKAPDSVTSAIESYYPYIMQQYLQNDLANQIIQSPKFVNDFQQVFFKQVYSPAAAHR